MARFGIFSSYSLSPIVLLDLRIFLPSKNYKEKILGELSFGKLKTKNIAEKYYSIDFPACCMTLQARRKSTYIHTPIHILLAHPRGAFQSNDEIHIKILATGETNLKFKFMI